MKTRKKFVGLITAILSLSCNASYGYQYSIKLADILYPTEINNSGEVGGKTEDNDVAMWSAKQGRITLRHNKIESTGYNGLSGINNKGQMIGSLSSCQCFWQNAGELPSTAQPSNAGSGTFTALNDNGDIVGSSQGNAYFWEYGSATASILGTLGGTANTAMAVNSAGTVCGYSSLKTGETLPCFWQNNIAIALKTLAGASAGYARNINDAGQMIGRCWGGIPSGNACLWNDVNSAPIDLGVLEGCRDSSAFSINELGEVVGASYRCGWDDGPVPFVWKNGTMSNLNSLITPGSGWVLENAVGINDLGQIVGTGHYNGQYATYVLTPVSVPEPAGILVICCGIGAIGGMSRIRRLIR